MDYRTYYQNQAGSGYPVFQGAKYQRGYGLGYIFKGLVRWIMPLMKTHALPLLTASSKELGKEALKTVTNVATDAIEVKNFENSIKERGYEAINSLKNKIETHIQKGSGKRKRAKLNKKHKRTKQDIFDHEFPS